jgi:hypothetical protein
MSSSYTSTAPLFTVGILGIFTVRVPENVTPLFFYGVSTLVAVVFFAIGFLIYFGLNSKSQNIRNLAWYGTGFALSSAVLAVAVYIVATLPPYSAA